MHHGVIGHEHENGAVVGGKFSHIARGWFVEVGIRHLRQGAQSGFARLVEQFQVLALGGEPFGGILTGGLLVVLITESLGKLRGGVGGADRAQERMLCTDQMAHLPGDVVGRGGRSNQQIRVGKVGHEHAEHILGRRQRILERIFAVIPPFLSIRFRARLRAAALESGCTCNGFHSIGPGHIRQPLSRQAHAC